MNFQGGADQNYPVIVSRVAAGSSADCARAASVWAKPAAAKANVRIESLRMNPL